MAKKETPKLIKKSPPSLLPFISLRLGEENPQTRRRRYVNVTLTLIVNFVFVCLQISKSADIIYWHNICANILTKSERASRARQQRKLSKMINGMRGIKLAALIQFTGLVAACSQTTTVYLVNIRASEQVRGS